MEKRRYNVFEVPYHCFSIKRSRRLFETRLLWMRNLLDFCSLFEFIKVCIHANKNRTRARQGGDVLARANDAQTFCRVTFNEHKHRKKPLCSIFIGISRSAPRSTCSAERFVFPRTRMSATWDKQIQVTFRGVSLANEEINILKFPFVINPRSSLFRYWETVSSIFIFSTSLIVPYQASFDSQSSTLWALAYIFDALYLVDVSLRFLVGYFSKGTLITDRSLIRRRYLRGMFIPDLLTLLPLDLLAFGVGTHLRWHQTLTLLRLNRILRVLRLLSFFGRLHTFCLLVDMF